MEKNQQLDFDVQTITAGDYTIEFDLPEKSYKYFKEVYFNENSPMSECAQFKLLVQKELEDRLTEMPNLGFDDEEENPDQSAANASVMAKSKYQQK